ncbi:Gfo/Idh/MocA family protein [Agromyces aerolatus]|uniref:Gfo/Idh/MocA family protein n=1 Tax=Agromyces sp. LY-1074 TaxID=3074080 RepID=UPI0028541BAD|nr:MULTISPECIES: Gfo/Idh/MocA family oxidoreductase [unclassified Agromyces]MDR5699551.1 Gfo/Idh/MocA family oxidoreductase [Agromyces sp. LY-1074]MDR5705847.1 Gfo/Idh/MocA family oxidoreductase [Agromyces sp. LY-1358]
MSTDRVRVVMVGAGDFGMRHIATAAALPELEVVAVADRDAARAAAAAARTGATAHASLAEALAGVAVDAVVIATPPAAHAADLRLAVDRGLPALVEKPVVTTAAELEELDTLDEAQKALVFPAHVSRFLPTFVAMREHVAGRRIRMIRAVRIVPAERVALHGDAHPALSAMVHDLDLIRALVPERLVHVQSEQAWTDDSRPFPQSVIAHLRFADGTIASVDNSWSLPHTRRYIDARMEVLADGLSASLALPGGGLRLDTVDGDFVPDVELEASAYGLPVGALATQLRHFAASVAGRPVERAVTLDEALWSVRTALTIVEQHGRD